MDFIDLKKQHQSLKQEVGAAIERVMESGKFLLGEELENFEKEFAEFCSSKRAVGVGSGTEALFLSLLALEIGPGDEVITTPFTFAATAEAIILAGAKPVFVDINEEDFNIDVEKIEQKITERTKAIMPVHLFGLPCDMDEILALAEKHNLFVIEDAAQAIGAEYKNKKIGAISDLTCFSFFPIKNLGACGNGGAIVTGDGRLAQKIKKMRSHGEIKPGYHENIGISGELDEIQAAILREKLKRLSSWNKKRVKIAGLYDEAFEKIKNFIKISPISRYKTHAFYSYSVIVENRDELQTYLRKLNIPTRVYYRTPLHLQPAFRFLGYKQDDFPIAEEISSKILALPIYPELEKDEIMQIIKAITSFYLLA